MNIKLFGGILLIMFAIFMPHIINGFNLFLKYLCHKTLKTNNNNSSLFKRFIIGFLQVLFLLTGSLYILGGLLPIDGDFYYYNGNQYDKISRMPSGYGENEIIGYWIPTGIGNRKAKAWVGYSEDFPSSGELKGNTKITLYDNDPDAIFFSHKAWMENHLIYYHRKDDILPRPYAKTAEIVLKLDSGKEIYVENGISIEFKRFIENSLINPESGSKELERNSNIIYIHIFHENYPAYNQFGNLIINPDKIIMLPLTSPNKYIYFELPDSLSKQIRQLIED